MEPTKGFITIATGKEEYYQLARNLLHSYHFFCKEQFPFAILCDRENKFTSEFDDVLILGDGATNSYLDKLNLGEYLPYDVNIFIDSDSLAFGDLNNLFNYFEDADDVSCFGRVLSLDDKSGWFEYENLGELRQKVSYVVGLHGGIYFLRKGSTCQTVFSDAKAMISDYAKFKFKGKFDTPGDEPLVALSMAINNCKPIPFVLGAICCYWEHEHHMHIDFTRGLAIVKQESKYNILLLHWGTRFTRKLEYQKQVRLMEILERPDEKTKLKIIKCKVYYYGKMIVEKRKLLISRIKNRMLKGIVYLKR